MGEANKTVNHMISSLAFVDGGAQDAYEDACSICFEAFTETDRSTMTSCKHEFHLQCILEWCQRSCNCPMCWQSISLKDPASQELLEVVERERNFSFNTARNSLTFHHPTLGDPEMQHLPVNANNAELEDHIIQHVERVHRVARRNGPRSRSSRGCPEFLTPPNSPPADDIPSSIVSIGDPRPFSTTARPLVRTAYSDGDLTQRNLQRSSYQRGQTSESASQSTVTSINRHKIGIYNRGVDSFGVEATEVERLMICSMMLLKEMEKNRWICHGNNSVVVFVCL